MRRYVYLQKILVTLFGAGMMQLPAISADAQNWALPGTKWQYTWQDYSFSGPTYPRYYTELTASRGDTILFGSVVTSRVSGGSISFDTYEQMGMVYIYLDGAYRQSYKFTAQEGDTLVFYNDTLRFHRHERPPGQRYFHGVVDSITLLTIGSTDLNVFNVRSWAFDDTIGRPRYIYFSYADQIGMLGKHWDAAYFYPDFSPPSDHGAFYVCNYGDSTLSSFWLYPDRSCRTVGIHDVPFGSLGLHCYPSPSSGTFTIDLPISGSKALHIYDAVGRLVWGRSSEGMSETVHLSTAGTYIVEVTAGDGRYRGRIVVE